MIAGRRAFLAGGLAAAGWVRAGEQAAVPALTLGVVNLRACFDKSKYARMAELAEDLGKLKNELVQEGQVLQKRINELTEQMDGAKGGSELYLEKLKLRAHAEYDLKLLAEVSKRKVSARVAEGETRIYADVRRAVAALARQLGVDLVLRSDEGRLPEEDPQANSGIGAREVLFHRDALDLTAQVLGRLNQDWAKAWTCAACRRKVADEQCPDCGAKRP
ncbi:MAG: OmpH family outer membrane protein [Planctomycetaceae bacterium]|nr:OmpH family outer membrane protein [Planctomycetaceae bacterium]